jgi:hypothetical protein
MANRIPITGTKLREAMRDCRYWQPGHPERDEFAGFFQGARAGAREWINVNAAGEDPSNIVRGGA